MRKPCYLVLMAMCLIALPAQAQVQVSEELPAPRYLSTQKKYTVTIQPMHWFNWSWRFDFETRLKDGPGWLQFGPAFYWMNKDMKNYQGDWNETRKSMHGPFSKLKGGGLDVNYKRFIDRRRGAYMATGLSYALFNIDYYGGRGEWKNYTEDGLPYHQFIYTVGTHTQTINRVGLNFLFGYQIPSPEIFILDLFGGISYRHAFLDQSMWHFDSLFSYGYTGPVLVIGFRFGFGIR